MESWGAGKLHVVGSGWGRTLSPDGFPPAQASSIENKQDWIKHIREVIQERTVHLRGALKEPIHIPKTAPAARQKGRR